MAGGSRSQALTRQNAAGWLMALPMVGLLFLFLVVPFFLGFVLSFTNQRLVSPNPTTFVGTANFEQLLGMGVLVLSPEKDDSGAVKMGTDGQPSYPSLRGFTRSQDKYPQYYGMKELFAFGWGDSRVEWSLTDDPAGTRFLVTEHHLPPRLEPP